jgi:hypothetical protein
VARALAEDLYDRFVMGGWEPDDAVPTVAKALIDANFRWNSSGENRVTFTSR